MKKILLSIFALAAMNSYAQLPNGSTAPDFTVTDLNGNTHNLYSYLESGKHVLLNVSATWCGPCWSYHNTHALADFYYAYGPMGSDEAMVLYVEGDSSTPVSALYGQGNNTLGDWTAGTPYPIIDNASIANSYQVAYFPTLYRICSNKITTEISRVAVAGLRNTVNNNCGTLTGVPNHIKITGGDIYACSYNGGSATFSFKNYGNNNITQAVIALKKNGNVVATQTYTGNLSQFNKANITFSGLDEIYPGTEYTVEVQSINDGGSVYNAAFANATAIAHVAGIVTTTTLQVATTLDQYASEAKWRIKDSNGQIVATSNTYSDTTHGNTTQTQQVTIPGDDCYSIELLDNYGDGWAWNTTLQTGVEVFENGNSIVFVDGLGVFSNAAPMIRPAAFRHGTASVQDIQVGTFNVYPNPSNGVFNISTSETVKISIVDITGKTVYQASSLEDNTVVDLSSLQSGIYLMKVKGETINKTEKLIIK